MRIKEMYADFRIDSKLEFEEVAKHITTYIEYRKNLLDKIKKHEVWINNNTTFRALTAITINAADIDKIKYTPTGKDGDITLSYLKSLLKAIHGYNIKLGKLSAINSRNLFLLGMNQEEFTFVTEYFDLLLVDKILNGYRDYNFGKGLGRVLMIPFARRYNAGNLHKNIDWGESNKTRQRIIDEGGIPYHKDTAPTGKKWFVYITDSLPKFKLRWEVSEALVNREFYTCTANYGGTPTLKIIENGMKLEDIKYSKYDIITKLSLYLKLNPEHYLKLMNN